MKKWQANVELFLSLLSPSDKNNYKQLIDILVDAGYVPHKMRVRGLVMAFKNPSHSPTPIRLLLKTLSSPWNWTVITRSII